MYATIDASAKSLRSSFYEQLVEHVFVSELLQEAWYGHGQIVEVLRAEVDASGFDLALECRYAAQPVVFRHRALLVSVNRSAAYTSLCEATRYSWKISGRRAQQAEVILATVHA